MSSSVGSCDDSICVSDIDEINSNKRKIFNVSSSDGSTMANELLDAATLLQLLRVGKTKEFVDCLNVPDDLEEKDDLDIMVSGTSASMNRTLCKNLYFFICSLAGSNVSESAMCAEKKFLLFCDQFQLMFENMSTMEEHIFGVLKSFKKKKLPKVFKKFVGELKVEPSKCWITRYRFDGKSPEELKRLKFGHMVRDVFEECKKCINGVANPLWICQNDLPSKISVYAYYYFMRLQMWPAKARERALYRSRMGKMRKLEKSKDSRPESDNGVAEFDINWYPDWWLAFMFLGLPAGKSTRDVFKLNQQALTFVAGPTRQLVSQGKKRKVVEVVSSITDSEACREEYVAGDLFRMYARDPNFREYLLLKEQLKCMDKLLTPATDEKYVATVGEMMALLEKLRKSNS
jgi:hypothetical protein